MPTIAAAADRIRALTAALAVAEENAARAKALAERAKIEADALREETYRIRNELERAKQELAAQEELSARGAAGGSTSAAVVKPVTIHSSVPATVAPPPTTPPGLVQPGAAGSGQSSILRPPSPPRFPHWYEPYTALGSQTAVPATALATTSTEPVRPPAADASRSVGSTG